MAECKEMSLEDEFGSSSLFSKLFSVRKLFDNEIDQFIDLCDE